MRTFLNTLSLSVAATVHSNIPRTYPNAADWVGAVGAGLVQNGIPATVVPPKVDNFWKKPIQVPPRAVELPQKVAEVWSTLGGSEMVQLSLKPLTPIESVVAVLFLAAELTFAADALLPDIRKATRPVCKKLRELPELLVNTVSKSLHELRNARRLVELPPVSIERVRILTPLANVHLVCNMETVMAASIHQVLINNVVQRNLKDYRAAAFPPLPEGMAFPEAHEKASNIITFFAGDRLMSGAVETRHLQVLYDAMFTNLIGIPVKNVFREIDGVFHVVPLKLEAYATERTKYMHSGRVLGLSILYNVPIGRKLDPQLLDFLCGPEDPKAGVEYTLLQSGFQESVSLDILNKLKISSKTVGTILTGMSSLAVSSLMVSAYIQTSDLAAPQRNELLKALQQSTTFPMKFVQFATGQRYLPVGGLAAVMPPISVGTDPSGRSVPSANRLDHKVKLPSNELKERLIRTLGAL